jgi:purine-binding chemotaxis protein CheW
MNLKSSGSLENVDALRKAFDESFAIRPGERNQNVEGLLVLRVSGVSYAVKLREIKGLFRKKKISPVPGPVPELLGFAGIKGILVPVYSLAALLGRGQENCDSKWFVLCQSSEAAFFALAVEEFEGYVDVAYSNITSDAVPSAKPRTFHQVARINDTSRVIVDIPTVLSLIQARIKK